MNANLMTRAAAPDRNNRPLVIAEKLSLAYGETKLLDAIQLKVFSAERLALIGRNGSGKSTLLRMIAGLADPDDGEVWIAPSAKLNFVAQETIFPDELTAEVAIAQSMGGAAQPWPRFRALGSKAEVATLSAEEQAEMDALSQIIDAASGWAFGSRIEQVLDELGLRPETACSTLSGGAQKRLALASAIASGSDILLLDEPTNHLDLGVLQWLEERLIAFSGAVVFVTHDRRFLDAIASRIVELDRGQLNSFPGRFSEYQARKAQMLEAEALAFAREDKLLAQEEIWIRQGVEARRTRAVGRINRLEVLRQRRADRSQKQGLVQLELDRGEASGKLVVQALEASFSYSDGRRHADPIIQGLELTMMRSDRLAILGPNGSGKTTLLKLLLGQLKPDSGRIRLGTKLNIAYFDQLRQQLDPDKPLVDVISPGSDFIEINGSRKHVIGYLGEFLFSPVRARQPVRSLSGGERARLLLARLFAQPVNLLVLDEPTNDLDLETLDLLESLLASYDGSVILVSHDRAFIDAVATQTLVFQGHGRWKEYIGGYQDWIAQGGVWISNDSPSEASIIKPAESRHPAKPLPSGADGNARDRANADSSGAIEPLQQTPASQLKPAVAKPSAVKLTNKERLALETLPDQIAAYESEEAKLQLELATPELWKDEALARRKQERLQTLTGMIAEAYAQWEALETKAQSSRT